MLLSIMYQSAPAVAIFGEILCQSTCLTKVNDIVFYLNPPPPIRSTIAGTLQPTYRFTPLSSQFVLYVKLFDRFFKTNLSNVLCCNFILYFLNGAIIVTSLTHIGLIVTNNTYKQQCESICLNVFLYLFLAFLQILCGIGNPQFQCHPILQIIWSLPYL